MRTSYNDLSDKLQKLFDEYHDIFGVYPDYYEELDCTYDVEQVKLAIEKKIDLPTLILGEGYWNNGTDY